MKRIKPRKIKFPIKVEKITYPDELIRDNVLLSKGKRGDFVAVMPCNKKYKGKTFLGILLGELPVGCGCTYKRKNKELKFWLHQNPAIYVPELKEIIFGCGSWWHVIESPADLRQITKSDINNTWYVKVLKELARVENAGKAKAGKR